MTRRRATVESMSWLVIVSPGAISVATRRPTTFVAASIGTSALTRIDACSMSSSVSTEPAATKCDATTIAVPSRLRVITATVPATLTAISESPTSVRGDGVTQRGRRNEIRMTAMFTHECRRRLSFPQSTRLQNFEFTLFDILEFMDNDFVLTPTDVADALGCSVTEVHHLIDSGRIVAHRDHGWKITHADLARFIDDEQTTAITLGRERVVSPSFSASRPIGGDSN